MPLSPATDREIAHTRRITCQGYRRADGLFDIEGHLTDVKSYPVPNEHRGTIEPGEPIHDMWIRLTMNDAFEVVAVEAVTESGPFDLCPAITPNFQRLVGLSIGPGWRRKVQERLGGVEGCTHMVELLGPVATTAYQTMYGEASRRRREAEARGEMVEREAGDPGGKPRLLNSCHAFAETSPVVKRNWPAHYRGD